MLWKLQQKKEHSKSFLNIPLKSFQRLKLIYKQFRTQIRNELQRVSFLVPDMLIQKIKTKMTTPFEQLKNRVILTSNQQLEATNVTMPPTFIPAFTI